MNPIKRYIPAALSERLRGMWYTGRARFCPVCGRNVRRFLPFGAPPRPDAKCPACGSLERHRLVWIFFREKTNLFGSAPQKTAPGVPAHESDISRCDRKVPVDLFHLGHVTDQAAVVGNRFAQNLDLALPGRNKTKHGLQKSRLTGAVGTDDSQNVAFRYVKRNVFQRCMVIVSNPQPIDR